MTRWVVYVPCAVLLGLLLGCMGLVFPIQIVFSLALGWFRFLQETLPRVRVSGSGVVSGLLVLILLIGVTHSFCGWLARQRNGPVWRASWTARMVGSVVILFGAGIAATGVAHQVGWLLMSPEPWVDSHSLLIGRIQSVQNLKQVGLALHNYADQHGTLPPAAEFDAQGRVRHGWQAQILPFLDQGALHDRIDFAVPWNDPGNAEVYRTRLPVYLIDQRNRPQEVHGLAASHYAGNALVLGGNRAWRFPEITDGTANTLLAGEVAHRIRPWGDPLQWRDPRLGINQSPAGFGSPWPGGANFLFVDGSVRFLGNAIASKVFQAASTPDGNDPQIEDSL